MNIFRLKDRNYSNRKFSASALLQTGLVLAFFALSSSAQAVTPAPDGGYPGFNTAEGDFALLSLTSGQYNTAIGTRALLGDKSGNENTAVGFNALRSNVSGPRNTAVGTNALFNNNNYNNTAVGHSALFNNLSFGNTAVGNLALFSNQSGYGNTAVGVQSLNVGNAGTFNTAVGTSALFNNTADENTAVGSFALEGNTIGVHNTAVGDFALRSNQTSGDNTGVGFHALTSSTGAANTALGSGALASNTSGSGHTAVGYNALASNTIAPTLAANTAVGALALKNNTTGGDNVAIGLFALNNNSTGSFNTAAGAGAGAQITGDNNIDIGGTVFGVAGESNTIRIGNSSITATYINGIRGQIAFNGTAVFVDATGKLGTLASSKQFKQDIKSMNNASEVILGFRPVTFRYKKEIDPSGATQFGLVAEEVEKVNPDLVVRDKDKKAYSVRYDQVNAMLLNEFLKEHGKVQEQGATIAALQKEIAILAVTVKNQGAQIQKMCAQNATNKTARRVVLNNP